MVLISLILAAVAIYLWIVLFAGLFMSREVINQFFSDGVFPYTPALWVCDAKTKSIQYLKKGLNWLLPRQKPGDMESKLNPFYKLDLSPNAERLAHANPGRPIGILKPDGNGGMKYESLDGRNIGNYTQPIESTNAYEVLQRASRIYNLRKKGMRTIPRSNPLGTTALRKLTGHFVMRGPGISAVQQRVGMSRLISWKGGSRG